MANTVNDVMNVIASPDYGIKNIAGTNQEILAILSGTHNSQNNIHAIVNDVKNLLQTLVDTSTKSKPIEIGNKSPKINPKNIQDILDETKGIRKSIDNLAKILMKQGGRNMPTIAKLSDKASDKVADAMLKDLSKDRKNSGLTNIVNAFNTLKNISLKDIIFGNLKLKYISKAFENAKDSLKIKEKDLNAIIKLINAAPAMVKSLSKISWRINRIIKNNIIQKLSDIFVGKTSLLSLSNLLQKNKKIFNEANKVSKDIKEFTSTLSKTLMKIFFASMWAKFADNGIKSIGSAISKTIPLATKLTKNKKDIEHARKSAKNLSALAGRLLTTSIFLSIAAVFAKPAEYGAKFLLTVVEKIITVCKELGKNNSIINKSTKAASKLVVFSGLMMVTSIFLTTMAVTGIPAMLGAIFMLGVIKITTSAFKMLSKATPNILKGSLAMLIMSTSLLVFGIALGKITNATKGVSWKQFGMIMGFLGAFGGIIAALGIPPVAIMIAVGSIAVITMSLSLMKFSEALKTIKSMGNVPEKQFNQVLKTMTALKQFYRNNPVGIKAISNAIKYLMIMPPFIKAVKHLTKLKELGTIPMKLVQGALDAMNVIAQHYTSNPIEKSVIKQARRYKRMMRPFGNTIKHLVKLKELGTIPMKLVEGTLNAMGAIANFYLNNSIDKNVIKQAKKYRKMLKPFGSTINYLVKLKEMGSLPMKLVQGALDAMSTIANYYLNNPIEKDVIKQAKRYRKMLKPFGNTINYLAKLKEIGVLPMKLVYGSLDAMSTIANYYLNNPIKRNVIKQAKRYRKMLKPFGSTINYLAKLKEMGSIPMKLVNNALNAMGTIVEFYQNSKLDLKQGAEAKVRASIISEMIESFGKSVGRLKSLNELRGVSANAINDIVYTVFNITKFYNNAVINDDIEEKSKFTENIVNGFVNLASNIQDKFNAIKQIDLNAIYSAIASCVAITDFYWTSLPSKKKVARMNDALEMFTNNANYLSIASQGFATSNFDGINSMITSMIDIFKFLKKDSLNNVQRKRAEKNLTMISQLTSAMSGLSNLNASNISSTGDSLTKALDGVNSVDMDKIQSVTNMFNAFNGINKSQNLIDKFTESVKEFTTVCKDLMDAMGQNTDAINNIDASNMGGSFTNVIEKNIFETGQTDNTSSQSGGGIKITNVEEIAKTIAEKINGAISVDIPDTQIQLLINGSGGNEWIISRY